MSASLNGKKYPLPDEFVDDLVAELERRAVALPTQVTALPEHPEREFDLTVEVTIPLKGVGVRTLGGDPPTVWTDWVYRRPDGSAASLALAVPEELRQQLNQATLSGQQIVTGAYEATRAQAEAAVRTAWGLE